MTELERSLRQQLEYYEPDLRGGRYIGSHSVEADTQGGSWRISSVYADIEDGLVSGITIYCKSNIMTWDHFLEVDCVDLIYPTEGYLNGTLSWDEMISEMLERIKWDIAMTERIKEP